MTIEAAVSAAEDVINLFVIKRNNSKTIFLSKLRDVRPFNSWLKYSNQFDIVSR